MAQASVKSLQNILKPICEMLVSKYADSCDFEAVMCILQNIDNKNPIWYHSSNIQNMKHQKIHEQATILHWAATYGQLSVIQYVCRSVLILTKIHVKFYSLSDHSVHIIQTKINL